MKTPTWRGSVNLHEAPDSPRFEDSDTGARYVRVFHGPYGTCLSQKPTRGSAVAGHPGFKVDSISVEKGPGGKGILTFAMVINPITEDLPVYEIEWVESQKDLLTHPIYRQGGTRLLNDTDLDQIEDWKSRSSASERTAKFDGLSNNAKHAATKLRRGTDSWVAYSPVARVTTIHPSKPNTGGCGTRNAPPAECSVGGYTYVKTADRLARRTRQWERVQEWTGAEYVDPDLYPS